MRIEALYSPGGADPKPVTIIAFLADADDNIIVVFFDSEGAIDSVKDVAKFEVQQGTRE